MAIEYRITLDDNHQFSYRIELDRQYDPQGAEATPKWTRLENNQCSNCPLKKDEFSRCPAAVDLHRVIEEFCRETNSDWGWRLLDDFPDYVGRFWLVKPKAADLESMLDRLRQRGE